MFMSSSVQSKRFLYLLNSHSISSRSYFTNSALLSSSLDSYARTNSLRHRRATKLLRKRYRNNIQSLSAKNSNGGDSPEDSSGKVRQEKLSFYFPHLDSSTAKFEPLDQFFPNKFLSDYIKPYINALIQSKLDNPDALIVQCNNSGANNFLENLLSDTTAEGYNFVSISREDVLRLIQRDSQKPNYSTTPKHSLGSENFSESVDSELASEIAKDPSATNELVNFFKKLGGTDLNAVIAIQPLERVSSEKSTFKEKNPLESGLNVLYKHYSSQDSNKPTIIYFKDVGLLDYIEQKDLVDSYNSIASGASKFKGKIVTMFAWTPDLKEYTESKVQAVGNESMYSPLYSWFQSKTVISIPLVDLNANEALMNVMEDGKKYRRINYNMSLLKMESARLNLRLLLKDETLIVKDRLLSARDARSLVSIAHGVIKTSERCKRAITDEDMKRSISIYQQMIPEPVLHPSESEERGSIQKINKLIIQRKHVLNKYEKRLLSSIVTPEDSGVQFRDIACLQKTKETLQSIIALPLLRPSLFKRGVLRNSVSGVLLFGPPGTGKTMLAKALAAECGSNFLNITASAIFNMYVGEGEKNVKAIFTLARKIAPCIVFVDELDAIFEARGSNASYSTKREVVNEFMSEWDGLVSKNDGIIVVGATNRPFDLDDAILRRLPRRLLIDIPNKQERKEILKVQLKDEILGEDISLDELSERTNMYSGSDLKNVCLHAALNSVKDILLEENKLISGQEKLLGDDGRLAVVPESQLTYAVPDRVLQKKHFDLALKEVSSSLDEKQETLERLREWARKFGERPNVTKSNPKSFGFTIKSFR